MLGGRTEATQEQYGHPPDRRRRPANRGRVPLINRRLDRPRQSITAARNPSKWSRFREPPRQHREQEKAMRSG